MHRLVVVAAVLAITAPIARADIETLPAPKREVAVTLIVFGTDHGGGAGGNVEVAAGKHEHQLFGEASFGLGGVGNGDLGFATRAALGGRWLVRSAVMPDAAFDLLFEGFVGAEYVKTDTAQLVTPEVGWGVGYQVRLREDDKTKTIRVMTRMYYAPPIYDSSTPATAATCRGTCPGPATPSSLGFMMMIGGAW